MNPIEISPGSSFSNHSRSRSYFEIALEKTRCAIALLLVLFCVPAALAEDVDDEEELIAEMKDLDIEELLDMEITSLSRKAEPLSETAAAIYVLTNEDIMRSGATTIPDLLRMVPGLQVAQCGAKAWAVTARGFNNQYANKLLVLMDGRSVYTPLFSGVNWELQNTMLEDIERIEVIRGPGASVWGANAVNGVINIISKHGKDTQGGLVSTGYGNEEEGFVRARYGDQIGENAWYRVYGMFHNRDSSDLVAGGRENDGWDITQGGFHLDWEPTESDQLHFQGDAYGFDGDSTMTWPKPPFGAFDNDTESQGSNILGRWTRTFSETSVLNFQFYYDRVDIDMPIFPRVHDTIDFELQHQFAFGEIQEIIWGLGYRSIRENVDNTTFFTITPQSRRDNVYSAFVQDDIDVVEDLLRITLGSKFEHNDYTGHEVQPSARVLWTPHEKHSVWASASRAVRTPSPIERGDLINAGFLDWAAPGVPIIMQLRGSDDYGSETLFAYELGYRVQPAESLSFDVAAFFNDYENLRTLEAGTAFFSFFPSLHMVAPLTAGNKMNAHTYGVEVAADWKTTDWWRLRGGYTFLQMQLDPDGNSTDLSSENAEGQNPHNQVSVRSLMDVGENVELDAGFRYVDRLPDLDIGNYAAFDLRLGWTPIDDLEIALVGQNLLRSKHEEFAPFFNFSQSTEVERSVYAQLIWRF